MRLSVGAALLCATLVAACTDDDALNAAYINAFATGVANPAAAPLPMVNVYGPNGKATTCLQGGTPQAPALFCQ